MKVNFKIVSKNFFKFGIFQKRRVYAVRIKRSGLLKIVNIFDGSTLADDLVLSDLSIDGAAILSLNDLQDVLHSRSCLCGDDPEPVIEIKIFDESFDPSFE